MKNWFLVYTKPHKEEYAKKNLLNQNFEAFCPFILKERIQKRKKTLYKEAMFSRYIFVRLESNGSQSWTPILNTKGVSNLVRFGSNYVKVQDKIIEDLKSNIKNLIPIKAFEEGEVVKIKNGPFNGIEAIFHSYNGDERAILLVKLLSKVIPGNFDLKQFKKVF